MVPFLAALSLAGRRCLVLGGDREALDKSRRLLAAGARLTLVAPNVLPALAALLATHEGATWHRRAFLDDDLAGPPHLVLCTEPDPALAARLFERAERERFALCCVDRARYSTFTNVASAELGPIALGLASGGLAPGLLRRLRDEIAAGLGGEFPDFVRYIAAVRASAVPGERRALVAAALAGFHLEIKPRFPAGWRERWGALGPFGARPGPPPADDASPGGEASSPRPSSPPRRR